jgi:hypothetical protein
MNRIILIGNGFDLAHGLKTSYRDFILHYWWSIDKEVGKLKYQDEVPFEDGLISIKSDYETRQLRNFIDTYGIYPKCSYITSHKFKSPLFQLIQKAFQNKRWVDIESVFYSLLKELCPDSSSISRSYETPDKLNDDLAIVKTKLVDFLRLIQDNEITADIVNKKIKKIIIEPFDPRDISRDGQNVFSEFIHRRFESAKNDNTQSIGLHLSKYRRRSINSMKGYLTEIKNDYDNHKSKIDGNHNAVPEFFLLPENTLFLNFNYTKTASLYNGRKYPFQLNHIHGELDNDKNPIIFGYGDEMDGHYKKIADLNDNEYLQNIKSIRYLETDNYRRLLTFIDSAPYQIYIMGHSCGNSDRTLLNTLFEHPKCVSIKPFYYKKPDGSDDYIDIVQNISRNFKNPTLMRDRVVNKTYCRPLPQNNS